MNALRSCLILENVRSLMARYPNDFKEMFEPAVDLLMQSRFEFCHEPTAWVAQSQWAMITSPVKGYRYQSCEHSGWDSSLASRVCTEIEQMILHRISMLTDREEAAWSNYKRPVQHTGPVRLSALLN